VRAHSHRTSVDRGTHALESEKEGVNPDDGYGRVGAGASALSKCVWGRSAYYFRRRRAA